MIRRALLLTVIGTAGCFTPVPIVCDGFVPNCDAGANGVPFDPNAAAGGGSAGTGGAAGTGGSGSSGGGSGSSGGGSGGLVIDGVVYQSDGGFVCPNAVTTFATAAECNPSTCADGCCDAARCIRGCAQSDGRCGVYAESCKSCSSGDRCNRGSCQGTGACSGCRNTDLCLSGTLAGSCGVGSCSSCEACVNQQCVTPQKRVGDACASDGDCASLGRGAFCRTQTSAGRAYPGGFCSLPCEGDHRVCPVSSECVSFPSRFGESRRLCAPLCQYGDAGTGCRAGYECFASLGWTGSPVCWISPAPALTGVAPIGSPCLTDGDCGTDRRCLRPFLPPRYEPNGYYGGYCTGVCTPGQACGDGNDVCTSEPFDTPVGPAIVNACKQPCSAPGFQGECRTDYVCIASAAGGWCGPRCPARACTGGTTCDLITGQCR